MPPWLDSAEEVAALLAAVATALGVIGAGFIGAVGTVIAAGVVVWRTKVKPALASTQAAAEVAAHEVLPNSGSSMRDAVNEIRKTVLQLHADQSTDRDEARRAHSEIFRRIRELETTNERFPP